MPTNPNLTKCVHCAYVLVSTAELKRIYGDSIGKFREKDFLSPDSDKKSLKGPHLCVFKRPLCFREKRMPVILSRSKFVTYSPCRSMFRVRLQLRFGLGLAWELEFQLPCDRISMTNLPCDEITGN